MVAHAKWLTMEPHLQTDDTVDTSAPDIPPAARLVTEVWGPFRTLLAARRNLLEIIPEAVTRRPIISGRTGGVRWHMVAEPDALRHILRDRLDNYPKSEVIKNILEPAIGQSLFIADGDHWRWQRRAAAPVFRRRSVDGLAPIMSAAADAACGRIRAGNGRAELHGEMIQTTFDVIGGVLLAGERKLDKEFVHGAIEAFLASAARVSVLDIAGLSTWIPRPRQFFRPRSLKVLRRIADDVIADRLKQRDRPDRDFLDTLLDGMDPESGRRMTPGELRDNLLAFIVAGHETTALALAWSFFLCAFDVQVQERLRAEAAAVLGGRTAGAEDVPNLPYTRSVIEEALRLYPPAAILSRTARAQDRICDREIRAGDTVILPIYALHRHRDLWDSPDSFDPGRFSGESQIERYAYLPFGDGPRVCIGASFAMLEAVIVLATLMSRFRFRRIRGLDPKPVMVLTLRPLGGVHLAVEQI